MECFHYEKMPHSVMSKEEASKFWKARRERLGSDSTISIPLYGKHREGISIPLKEGK